ncbi:MAG TPA: type VII secretion target [Actinophytocola sp.]|uniref:type VII secretion target n=1 Tax=Actinophytocola sp. TaxID=1872138 RepID=UPI002DB6A844|nr:type VII secretion target [Actinophytocola sp.]HEU5474623.1 type VII secretion target [Actinophytocola sp.]
MSGFAAAVPALRAHARTLQGLAGELGGAVDVAGGVSMPAEAYGQTARKFAIAIEELSRIGQEAMRAGVAALETAGTTLAEIATAYERGDDDGADRIGAIDGELSPPSS